MKVIAELLYRYRDMTTMTQSELADELREYSDQFSALNIVTLSRWENSVTKPGLKKQQTLLKFLFSKGCFSNIECQNIIKERYGHLQEGLEKAFDRQFKSQIGNFPEADSFNHTLHSLKTHPNREYLFDLIVQIERASNPEGAPYSVTPEMLAQWCEHPGTFAYICEAHEQHAGHYILLKLKSAVADDIVYQRRDRSSITLNDLCGPEEKGSYLTLTLFARSGKVAAWLNIQHYLHLAEQIDTIENITIFSRREDTVPMTRTYGTKLVASGIDENDGQKWYGLSASIEDVLFSETVVEAIY